MVHPGTHEVLGLINEVNGVRSRLQAQDHRHPTFPTALIFLIQREFNESLHQELERQKRVLWL